MYSLYDKNDKGYKIDGLEMNCCRKCYQSKLYYPDGTIVNQIVSCFKEVKMSSGFKSWKKIVDINGANFDCWDIHQYICVNDGIKINVGNDEIYFNVNSKQGTPTASRSPNPTFTPTANATATQSAFPTLTATPVPTLTATPFATLTATPFATLTATPNPTVSKIIIKTLSPSRSPSMTVRIYYSTRPD